MGPMKQTEIVNFSILLDVDNDLHLSSKFSIVWPLHHYIFRELSDLKQIIWQAKYFSRIYTLEQNKRGRWFRAPPKFI